MSRSNWFTMSQPISATLFAIIVLKCIAQSNGVAVMSIDFGSEWMKVAIVSPGVPMEIALNKESKRKTPIAIAFRNGERTFGEDALAVGVRFPKNCYVYLLELLGKTVDNPVVEQYKKRFPYYNIIPDDERNTVVFQHDDDTKFGVEELVAMMINKAREIAQITANQVINEAVITVPGFFNQAERKAMLQAAELANVKVLQLMNDYTAVALNYGIFRRKDFNETAQYIMLYDMGASKTTATVISYQLVKTKEKGYVETNPQLSILGVGYDRTLGGLEMQLRLRDYLGKRFNELKKTDKDVFQNPRAVAKLFKEAARLKTILSANVDHYAQVEGLLDEVDFKLQVTREEFENLCTDLFERVKIPVEKALKASGLTMDVMSQVILFGAGTRVPAVQDKLSSIVGIELSKNLNTDEAAVFGAVYKAADLSAGFKVKKFVTKDAVLFPIQVVFEREGETNVKQMKRTLFAYMNAYPQKKILTFNKNTQDFDFNVTYGDIEHLSEDEIKNLGPLSISKVSLKGVTDALQKHTGPNVETKGIKAHFNMDESGILKLVNVELAVEKTVIDGETIEESPLSKLGSTISKLFTGPEETLKETIEKPDEKEELKDDKKDDKGSEANKTKEAEKPKDEKPKIVILKEPIGTLEDMLTVPALNEKQLLESNTKLQALNKNDEIKRKHENALNALESSIFDVKSKLELKEYKSAASESEKTAILDLCAKLGDWFDEEGLSAPVEDLESKLEELKKATKDVWERVKEAQDRPEVIASMDTLLNGSRNFLEMAKNMTNQQPDDASVFTKVELDGLEKIIKDTKDWKDSAILEQNKLSPFETPKLTKKLIKDKMNSLEREVKYLVNKLKIWKPKVEEKPKETPGNETVTNKTNAEETIIPPKPAEAETPEVKVETEKTEANEEKAHEEL